MWLRVDLGTVGVDARQVEHDHQRIGGLVHIHGWRPDRRRLRVLVEDDGRALTGAMEVRQVALHFTLPLVVVCHCCRLTRSVALAKLTPRKFCRTTRGGSW